MASVPIKMNRPAPPISVDTFYFALMKSDEVGSAGPEYETPQRIPGLVSVAFNPNSQNNTFHADGGPYSTAARTGEQALTVGLADIPPAVQAVWFGQKRKNGVLIGQQISPPDMAVGYRVENADGGYRYFWFLKCKASPPSTTVNTQGSSISFQSGTITISCVIPVSYEDEGAYRVLDDNDPELEEEDVTPALIAGNWFTDPMWDPIESEVIA